ncbi:unnamed protein product [Didymodactylos carnosus]|uniref:Uncharacterized protein n=1 Tax=Didymodactylos carnosus TaxID=1234261 RepID=A0A8S2XNM7_9BILA|nr:unnamed protein product [Didymodactylos carnosus]CAF4508306.1 unnamed protein product [Didymodactylos carnosus]
MMSISQYLRDTYRTVEDYLKQLNLFSSYPPLTDGHERQNELISTRVYLVTLIASLIILVICTAVIPRTLTVSIESPSLEQYIQLYRKYPQTLTCQCSATGVLYEKFIQLSVTRYHQLCSSQFITDDWIQYLNSEPADQLYLRDFRRIGGYSFQLLSRLCLISNQTINDELLVFQSTALITLSLMPNTTFQLQTQSFIKQFQLSTTQTFVRTLNFTQKTTQANGIMSGLLTNFQKASNVYTVIADPLSLVPSVYVNKNNLTCSCDVPLKCFEPLAIYNYNSNSLTLTLKFVVRGFYSGCFIVDSLLQSTLECFYQRQCINEIQSWITTNFTIVSPLDPTLKSQYRPTTSIQEIVNNLMIEQWSTTLSFSSYYDECHPTACTYSYTHSFDLLYTISMLLALIGGLTKILKVIVPNVVRFIRRKATQPNETAGTKQNDLFFKQRSQNYFDNSCFFYQSLAIPTVKKKSRIA